MNALKQLFQRFPVLYFLLFSFIICSWPFVYFPLTDADIAHWVKVAREIEVHSHFLNSSHDQAHGPLLAWTGGLLTKLAPQSFYFYNLFNLFCGLYGIGLVYFLSQRLWPKSHTAGIATALFATSLVHVYLSRTPMYDWPAALFYFSFGGFYLLHIKEKDDRFYVLAMISVGAASLLRFSISIGLAGVYMLLVNLTYRQPLWRSLRDGFMLPLVALASNLPWLLSQWQSHGHAFGHEFVYDNVGRYFKEPQSDAPVYRDYYGFALYTLVLILPHTFFLLASLFQKAFGSHLKQSKELLAMLAGFLPCLLIFSFSGHVKLARYIAYVFPFLFVFLGHLMSTHDLHNPAWRKSCRRYLGVTLIGLTVILTALIFQFSRQTQEGLLFVIGLFVLLYGQLGVSYFIVTRAHEDFAVRPQRYLWHYGIFYLLFFSILSYEAQHVEFLTSVHHIIREAIR